MSKPRNGRALGKRVFLVVAGMIAFTLVFVLACRIAVREMFRGIASSRSSGLEALVGDFDSPYPAGPMLQKGSASQPWVSRSADLRMRTPSFEPAARSLGQIAAQHQGFLENLMTESHSGGGRALFAVVSVPSTEFYPALADLKKLGRTEAVSEAGEDSAVKLENATRNLTAAQGTLSRLQNLQRDRKGQLHEALEVEKEIAQADSSVRDAMRQREALLSTVAQAHIRVTLLEDFRAPFEAHLTEASLQLRNALVEGLSGILQSVSLVAGGLLEYGLPLLFWCGVLAWPARKLWVRWHAKPLAAELGASR